MPQIGRMLGDQGGDFVFSVEAHAQLEVWLQKALISASPQERLKAAYELWETIESSDDAHIVAFARQTLEGMQYDSDLFVKEAVRQVLKKLGNHEATAPLSPTGPMPAYEPPQRTVEPAFTASDHADNQTLTTRENPTIKRMQEAETIPYRPKNWSQRLDDALSNMPASPDDDPSHSAPTIPRRPNKWNPLKRE